MICIPCIVICGGCKFEVEQCIPTQHGMMNMLILDTRVSPEGWATRTMNSCAQTAWARESSSC